MRFLTTFAILALGLAVQAHAIDAPSSPAFASQSLPGVRHSLTDDGYWKIEADSRTGDRALAIDKALYRAAELAGAGGKTFVEMHDAFSRRSGPQESATLYARGVDLGVHPTKCRSGKGKRCYTADAGILLRQLSGASGREAGVPIPSYDKYGRTVLESGFGIGAVAR